MSSRATIIGWLTSRVGFPFSESELSPVLRRRVGEVTDVAQRVNGQTYLIDQKYVEVANLNSQKTSQTKWMIASAALGALLLIIIVGAALFVVTYIMYQRRKKTEQLIKERSLEIAALNYERTALNSTFDASLKALGSEIFSELSSSYGARVASSSTGATVQVVRETIKEVVMVPCNYCHSLIPQTSFRCPQCGATRKN
jgi:rubrerythrin